MYCKAIYYYDNIIIQTMGLQSDTISGYSKFIMCIKLVSTLQNIHNVVHCGGKKIKY